MQISTQLRKTPSTTTEGSLTGDIVRVPRRPKTKCDSKSQTDKPRRYTVADLPLPPGEALRWRDHFVPLLLSWAGAQKDPFGVNQLLRSEVAQIWERIFPKAKLKESDVPVLLKTVRFFLRSSRVTF
jgi:hypothetical protein